MITPSRPGTAPGPIASLSKGVQAGHPVATRPVTVPAVGTNTQRRWVSACSSHVATDCCLSRAESDGSHVTPQVSSPGHTRAHGSPASYKREAAGSTPAAPTMAVLFESWSKRPR